MPDIPQGFNFMLGLVRSWVTEPLRIDPVVCCSISYVVEISHSILHRTVDSLHWLESGVEFQDLGYILLTALRLGLHYRLDKLSVYRFSVLCTTLALNHPCQVTIAVLQCKHDNFILESLTVLWPLLSSSPACHGEWVLPWSWAW